jgi:hydroxymethylglutaryl-CoA lyase
MKIIECPRDAMQGISQFIPTNKKIEYINQLLKVGFDTIDFGSFVSPKIIPQLRDTAKVLDGLDLCSTSSKLLAIIANIRGANDACNFQEINYLGFPLSVSEEFQKRNTNKSIDQSLKIVEDIQNLSVRNNKELVVYLSMAFGNPYNEDWDPDSLVRLIKRLDDIGVGTIALADTIGVSNPDNITMLFSSLISEYTSIEFGAHFHTTQDSWKEKVEAAYQNGCRRFDAALKGYGGCPMAKDELVGNMPTERLIAYFQDDLCINKHELDKGLVLSSLIFA